MHTYAEHQADQARLWEELREAAGLNAPAPTHEQLKASIASAVATQYSLNNFNIEITSVVENEAQFVVRYGAVTLYGAHKKNKLTRTTRTSVFADRVQRDKLLTKGPRTAAELLENLIETRAEEGRSSVR
jgi:hypothetical protein